MNKLTIPTLLVLTSSLLPQESIFGLRAPFASRGVFFSRLITPDRAPRVAVTGSQGEVRVADARTGRVLVDLANLRPEPIGDGAFLNANGDLDPDIVLTYPQSGTAVVRLGPDYSGSFEWGLRTSAGHVAVGDITGDGIDDLLFGDGNAGGGNGRVEAWDTAARRRIVSRDGASSEGLGERVAIGDADGDGNPDLAASAPYTGGDRGSIVLYDPLASRWATARLGQHFDFMGRDGLCVPEPGHLVTSSGAAASGAGTVWSIGAAFGSVRWAASGQTGQQIGRDLEYAVAEGWMITRDLADAPFAVDLRTGNVVPSGFAFPLNLWDVGFLDVDGDGDSEVYSVRNSIVPQFSGVEVGSLGPVDFKVDERAVSVATGGTQTFQIVVDPAVHGGDLYGLFTSPAFVLGSGPSVGGAQLHLPFILPMPVANQAGVIPPNGLVDVLLNVPQLPPAAAGIDLYHQAAFVRPSTASIRLSTLQVTRLEQ